MPIRMTGMVSGLDTESIVSALVSSYSTKTEKYKKAQTKLSWKQDAWKSVNTDVHDLYSLAGQLKFSSAYSLKKATISDATKATVTADGSAAAGTRKLNVISLAQSAYMTGGIATMTENVTDEDGNTVKDDDGNIKTKKGTIKKDTILTNIDGFKLATAEGATESSGSFKVTVGSGDDAKTATIKLGSTSKVSDIVSQLTAAGLNASWDENQQRFYISAKNSGADGDFKIESDGTTNSDTNLEALGLTTTATDTSKQANVIAGKDAEIKLNGVTYTGKTNQFTIDGLTINATAETGDGDDKAVSVTTSVDNQGIYDKVKDFFSKYNEVINSINKLYNADSAKDYEPLSDDEKAAMSDTEVEKWESKIKSALLRKDTTLGGIISTMSNAMSGVFTVNGKQMSLVSDLGIHTLSYFSVTKNENYAFHIDGDADDESVSGNDDKLMAAINKDPDAVIDFMKAVTGKLYDELGSKMKSTTMSSAYTIYNDKEMASEYSDYTDLISKWEDKLEDMEDSYYKKFSSMESALSKLQNSTSSITGMLG